MEIWIAVIAGASGVVGSFIPQLFAFLNNKRNFQIELRKEYKYKKIEAYSKLINTIWECHYIPIDKGKEEEWARRADNTLSSFSLEHIVWLDSQTMERINKIRSMMKEIIDGNNTKEKYSKFEDIIDANAQLIKSCRAIIQQEYYIKS